MSWKAWSPPTSTCGQVRASSSSMLYSAWALNLSGSVSMPLIKGGEVVTDRFARLADDIPVPKDAAAIITGARFLASPDKFLQREGPMGVAWPNDWRVS